MAVTAAKAESRGLSVQTWCQTTEHNHPQQSLYRWPYCHHIISGARKQVDTPRPGNAHLLSKGEFKAHQIEGHCADQGKSNPPPTHTHTSFLFLFFLGWQGNSIHQLEVWKESGQSSTSLRTVAPPQSTTVELRNWLCEVHRSGITGRSAALLHTGLHVWGVHCAEHQQQPTKMAGNVMQSVQQYRKPMYSKG